MENIYVDFYNYTAIIIGVLTTIFATFMFRNNQDEFDKRHMGTTGAMLLGSVAGLVIGMGWVVFVPMAAISYIGIYLQKKWENK